MAVLHSIRHVRLLAGLVAIASLGLMTPPVEAQQPFANPDEATGALATAVKSGMKQNILKVLGADGEDIISSGDDVADTDARNKFVAAYDAKHSVKVDGKKASLIIGADDFAFPIPLIHTRAAGNSIPPRAGRKSSIAVSAATSSTRFRPASPSSMRKTNMPRRIAATAWVFMRSASSAVPARRTASIGRRTITTAVGPAAADASAEGYKAVASRSPITAIITVS